MKSGIRAMYGMINKAIQELLTARLGEAAWKAICKD